MQSALVVRRSKRVTGSAKAGLVFPVGRVYRFLKEAKLASRISAGAPVYLTAVMEYLSAEVLSIAGGYCKDARRSRITPRFITLSILNDDELHKVCGDVLIPAGGVMPHIDPALLYKRDGSKLPRAYKTDYPSVYYACRAFARQNAKPVPSWSKFKKRYEVFGCDVPAVGWIDSWLTKHYATRAEYTEMMEEKESKKISICLR